MARNEAGLRDALARIPELRDEFWRTCRCPGSERDLNQALEYAGRVADYLEFAELLALDALERRESCGGHFREEYQTPENEARRDDEHFAHVAAWEYTGDGRAPSATPNRSSSNTSSRRSAATSRGTAAIHEA